MENVILTIHLLLALALIGVVLLQRSEGGGLGLGGGGGGDGIMSGRSAASALSKVTWILAVAFIITSMGLTVLAARNATGTSVVDRLGIIDGSGENVIPSVGEIEAILPPSNADETPLLPSAD